MRFIATFDLSAFVNSAVCLLAAFVLGTLIGAERQYRQRSAGLRTNALVALGAAAGSALLAEAAALTAPVIAGAPCCARSSTRSTASRSTSAHRKRPTRCG